MTVTLETPHHTAPSKPPAVQLIDGTSCDITRLSLDQLAALQWEQEVAYAAAIKATAKGSVERTAIIGQAYGTVCAILARIAQLEGHENLAMGMDRRYADFVQHRLTQLQARGVSGGLFEVGFGSGLLLESISEHGFRVGGLEVAESLHAQATRRLPTDCANHLLLGNFIDHPQREVLGESFSLAYWNDVFEHIPVDEIDAYLAGIYDLLVPGGELITITPNWHMRPMDVSRSYLPPRSTAIGFHLREYKLSEVRQLLLDAGFRNVRTPTFVGKHRVYDYGTHACTTTKCIVEPGLAWLPQTLAIQLCRRFGFCFTIATK